MRKIFELLATVMLVGGLAGVVHHFAGWFRVWGIIRHVPVMRDHELPAGIVLAVLGFALFWVLETLEKREDRMAATKRDEPSST